MSWKGFQKGVTRAPQNFKQRLNISQGTKDPVYIDAERRFQAIETQTKKLHSESKRYWTAISQMLNHQIEFSRAIEEVYKPISGQVSNPDTLEPEGNPEGIAACEQYRDLVEELQALLRPELELIETKVLKPADELLSLSKTIKKMFTKRDHKLLDLDRHTNSLKKLQEKKERSVKDEEKLFKVENDVEIATEEFNYYNELLKDELPQLFKLEAEFIKPLFESFYYMQLNIYYTLYTRMEEMKIPYFDLTTPVMQQFLQKRGDIKERTEAISLTHFRVGHAKAKLELTKKRYNKGDETESAAASPGSPAPPAYAVDPSQQYASPIAGQPAYIQPAQVPGQPTYGQPTYGQPAYGQPAYSQPAYGQPTYGQPTPVAVEKPTAASPVIQQPSEKQTYQPVAAAAPVPHAAVPTGEWCTALYDYAAQADGDLTFNAGDRIQIVQRTADANGWWTGNLNGIQGVFPGNYVQLG